ncbi:MAG: sulfotransferase family 2 domain-containing protein [Nitrospirota bacterium]
MNISDHNKCIFIHIPRTGGTSFKEAMGLMGRGHLPWQYYFVVYPEQWKTYAKFSVVRNPWDRAVSAYSYARMEKSYWHDNINRIASHPDYALLRNKTFRDCCEILLNNRDLLVHESWYPQHFWIMNNEDEKFQLMVDSVLRFETLDEDLSDFCARMGMEKICLPHWNKSPHEDYRKLYDNHTREIIGRLYAEDIRLFQYQFSTYMPGK